MNLIGFLVLSSLFALVISGIILLSTLFIYHKTNSRIASVLFALISINVYAFSISYIARLVL